MNKLEHRIPPPLLMLVEALVMWLATRLLPAATSASWRYGGTVLFGAIAFGFAVSGVRSFQRARTTINPVRIDEASHLVTSGVFGVTRNPMYVALTALLMAWACWLASPWVWAGPLSFALFIHRFQILPEERVLAEKFGSAYDAYRRRVRRWI